MEIKQTNEIKVIGVKGKCRMANTMEDCPPIWNKLMENKDKIKNKTNDTIAYGVQTAIDKENFYTLACFEVNSLDDIPEEMTAETIPPMKVAVITHKELLSGLKETYEKVCKDIPDEGMEIDWSKPCIEMYDEKFKQDSEDSVIEIWMPLK